MEGRLCRIGPWPPSHPMPRLPSSWNSVRTEASRPLFQRPLTIPVSSLCLLTWWPTPPGPTYVAAAAPPLTCGPPGASTHVDKSSSWSSHSSAFPARPLSFSRQLWSSRLFPSISQLRLVSRVQHEAERGLEPRWSGSSLAPDHCAGSSRGPSRPCIHLAR